MPLFFLLVGALFIYAGFNGRLGELSALIKEDFSPTDGSNGFAIWIVAIFAIGAIGYYKPAKPLSNAFLLLVVVSLILSNRGFFARFKQGLELR